MVSEFSSTWEAACTAASVFIPVAIVASSRGSRAHALAIAGVPVEALTAIVIIINTLAGTVTGVPVVVFSANLFKAVAAAAVDVPVEAFLASLDHAASTPDGVSSPYLSAVRVLVEVGLGRWSAHDVKAALEARDRAACGVVAPPHGLYLVSVGYE